MKTLAKTLVLAVLAAGTPHAVSADSTPAVPSGAVGATFHYTIGVKTPKNSKSSSGNITIAPAGSNRLNLTVTSDDGTTKTIPLEISDGSVKPATPASSTSSVPAAAQTLMANMKLASTVGVAAKKSGGSSFSVPVQLTPVGDGSPVGAQLAMKATTASGKTTYSGTVGGSTTTKLPQNGGMDADQVAATAGVGMVAGPRAALLMHHREEQMKKAEQNGLTDAMSLTVTAAFENGRFGEIHGEQTDALNVAGKAVKIYSTWSFTRVR